VKELWRDGKGRGLSELVGCVRYAGRSLLQRGGTAKAMERLEKLSDKVTEGRSIALEWKRNGLNEVVGS